MDFVTPDRISIDAILSDFRTRNGKPLAGIKDGDLGEFIAAELDVWFETQRREIARLVIERDKLKAMVLDRSG